MRVSTEGQDLERQDSIITDAKNKGYYIAGVYREKASGARPDRPELLRLISDMQPGEVVIAERIDRISRLPLPDAIALVDSIRAKGAKIVVPGVVDLSDIAEKQEGIARIVLDSVQEMLLRISLQISREEYETRRVRQKQGIAKAKSMGRYAGKPKNTEMHLEIVRLRSENFSIARTAEILKCSKTLVKTAWRQRAS